MISLLQTLLNTHPFFGRVDWIGLRPARRAEMVPLERAELTPSGLAGDHHAVVSPRAVTLIQAEHLPVIAALARTVVTPDMLRRNIVVSGINLAALKNKPLWLGDAQIKLTKPCAPCSRMEQTVGLGGYNAMRGHGGWYAEVLQPGTFGIGEDVRPASKSDS